MLKYGFSAIKTMKDEPFYQIKETIVKILPGEIVSANYKEGISSRFYNNFWEIGERMLRTCGQIVLALPNDPGAMEPSRGQQQREKESKAWYTEQVKKLTAIRDEILKEHGYKPFWQGIPDPEERIRTSLKNDLVHISYDISCGELQTKWRNNGKKRWNNKKIVLTERVKIGFSETEPWRWL